MGPRANQRKRTQTAIVAAASELIERGTIPSVADAAEAAEVSRATAYRYFPTQGALIAEIATRASERVDEYEFGSEDPVERAEEMVDIAFDLFERVEHSMRASLRLALEQRARPAAEEEKVPRGGRRPWIEAVLAPLEGRMDRRRIERLGASLALTVGIETVIVLEDMYGMDRGAARATAKFAARAIVEAAIREEEADRG